jgi:hypothetical protein
MSIAEAKRELFNQLKSNAAVRGAGIKEKNGSEYIVIFLTQPKKIIGIKIPSSYKGNKVVTEVTSTPKAM